MLRTPCKRVETKPQRMASLPSRLQPPATNRVSPRASSAGVSASSTASATSALKAIAPPPCGSSVRASKALRKTLRGAPKSMPW